MKTAEEKLKDLIKSNQERKQKLAEAEGFQDVDQYKQYLVLLINGAISSPKIEEKPTIHLVDVSDASGSMASNNKYEVSKKGILKGLEEFRKEINVNYTYSFVEFVESDKIIEHQFVGSLDIKPKFYGPKGGNTPLYETIYNTLNKLNTLIPAGDKVLVKVYTDGGNNTSEYYGEKAKKLITQLSDNFTVTLVGAGSYDLNRAILTLGLDQSNTLLVDNTGEGFEKAFISSLGATRTYSQKVLKKQDVKTGFYSKKVGKL